MASAPDPARRERLESVFQAAADVPMGERGALLDERCAGDGALRAEAEALLREFDAGTLSLLDQSRSSVFTFRGERAGDRIDRYTLVEEIGEGGFGTVFRAEQTEPVRRDVAMKILKAGMDTRAVLARFDAERQTLARMDHPGIARVIDAGSTQGGRPYFVMELVRGVPLNRYADQRSLTIEARLRLFLEVCRAVQHAHLKGIIHRDLKPSNLLVEEHEGRPLPKVIDFGIAKATSEPLVEQSLATQQGQLIGTPEYMSPEQAAGDGASVDTRTDVYALGVILYELLIGALPFDPGTLRSGGVAAMQRLIREQDLPRPTQRFGALGEEARELAARQRRTDPAALRRAVRGDLEWITLRATEKSPERRYASVAALAEDIDRHLANRPVLAGPPGAGYRASKFIRRHRVPVAAGFAVAVALAAGAVAAGVGFVRAQRERDRAVGAEAVALERGQEAERERDRAASEAARASAINEFLLQRMLAAASPWRDGRDVRVADVLERAGREAGGVFVDQPEIHAAVLATLGDTFNTLGEYDDAQRILDEALMVSRAKLGESHSATLAAMRARAGVHFFRGEMDEAAAILTPLLERAREHLGPDHEVTLKTMRDLGAVSMRKGDMEVAESFVRAYAAAHERLYGPDDRRTLDSKQTVASLLSQMGRFQEADPMVEECIAAARALKQQPNALLASGLFLRSGNANARGDSSRAEADAREAVVVFRQVYGDDHPQTVLALSSLSNALRAQQRFEEAEPPLREAVAILDRSVGAEHPWYFTLRNSLANLLLRADRIEEAERETRSLVEDRTAMLGAEHPDTLISRHLLGRIYGQRGRHAECFEQLESTIEAFNRSLGPEHPDTLNTVADYAAFLDEAGELERSVEVISGLIATEKRIWGETNPYALANSRALAETLIKLGRTEEAEALVRWVIGAYRSDHPDRLNPTLTALLVHARALAALGRHAEAEPLLVEVHTEAEGLPPQRAEALRRRAAEGLAEACAALGRRGDAERWRGLARGADDPDPAASN